MPRANNTKLLGTLGEDFATKLLVSKGYKIIERNFSTRYAEIDIIASDKDTLVFIEVKTRRSIRRGLPKEAVNTRKLDKIKSASYSYIQIRKPKFKKYRIDVVSIIVDGDDNVTAEIINTQ